MNTYLKIVCFSMAVVLISGQDINKCFEQDSISCVQKSLYRKAKEFFTKDSIELFSGVSLVKSAARDSRGSKDVIYDQEIDAANDVAGRQSALENFVSDEASDFMTGRSLRINFAPVVEKIGQTARAMVDSVPQEVRQAVDEVVEGRGKKKLLKSILPLLIAAKVKIGALAVLAYFGIALLAKKAIFASLISLAISAFIGLKSLWSKGADTTAYNAGWNSGSVGGWSPPVANGGWSSGGWDDGHGSYAGQNQPFSGYH
ncbi:uncharacterized protein LOC130677980 [Microplitis mediator]|uniref:uncharacterized protein LOC130677980 n=1 Tax=Microplitis mediator TaxID=375433 RepID=UPI00255582D5|nr:uncharacterized protein LOC130677980 [Microplitis mediator]